MDARHGGDAVTSRSLNTPSSDTPLTDEEVKYVSWDIDAQQMVGIDEEGTYVPAEFARDLERHFRVCDEERKAERALLHEAYRFLNAQASTQEEIEEFMGRLNKHFGLRGDF